jgi:uncharacterized protein (TIGR00251 family)
MTARVSIKVQPKASREGVGGRLGEEWKILVRAPAIEGRANEACVEFFARGLRVPRSAVRIASGAASRHKRIEIEGVAQETLERFLESAP